MFISIKRQNSELAIINIHLLTLKQVAMIRRYSMPNLPKSISKIKLEFSKPS